MRHVLQLRSQFMRHVVFSLSLIALLWLARVDHARADTFGPAPQSSPSVFSYAYRGLLTGGLVGLSGGYIAARRGGFHGEDWRPMVLGAGIGALSGVVVGFTLGFVDLASDHPGRGAIALRDMLYGAAFGTLVGVIVGALVIIRTHDAENVGFGGAIGSLCGAGLGLGIGIYEGTRIMSSPAHQAWLRTRVLPGLSSALDVRGQLALGAGLSGHF
jgi:hypothetical protein